MKVRPQTGKEKKKEFKTNTRNLLSKNNQQVVKIEKELAKKDQLQRRLEKLSKTYKKHFEGVELK